MTEEQIEQQKSEEKVYSVLALFLLVPLILTKGGAFYLLYKWFALPITHYPLAFWQVVGLVILADTANIALREPKPNKPAKEVYAMCQSRVIGYAASILFGWLVKLMM